MKSGATANAVEARNNAGTLAWFGLLTAVGICLWYAQTWRCVADDSYFYLVIARSLATKSQQSFSNLFSTNGFHPLWGYLLAAYTWLVNAVWPHAVNHVSYALPLSAALLLGTAVQSWRLARSLDLAPVVVTTLIIGFQISLSVLYSEAPLFLLLLLTLLLMIARDPEAAVTRPVTFGLVAAGIVLSRLDAVFFVGFAYLYYFWQFRLNPRFVINGIVCGSLVGAYIVSNVVFFGGAMPISGWMKGSFPYPFPRGIAVAEFPRLQLITIGGYSLLLGWLPLVLGVVTLLAFRLERVQRVLLSLLCVGTLAHAAYVALFTRGHTMWPWYYILPLCVLAMSLGILAQRGRKYRAQSVILALLTIAITTACLDKARGAPDSDLIECVKRHGIRGKTLLVSDWPGALAYYTDNNVIAADMLTFNRVDFERMRADPNALEFLVNECERLGQPLKYVIFVGNNWLTWDDSTKKITFNDPRYYPVLKPIGELQTRETPTGLQCADGIEVWLLERDGNFNPCGKLRTNEMAAQSGP